MGMNNSAKDNFESYFTEKLWEMIPPFYRHEDGIAENPGVLHSFVELLATQAAHLRRSIDHLWDDQYIELCNDWAVPYIADLLGTRLLSGENKRGRRIDVAKTIYYRRRKGTVRILEELISDISGWDGKVVENFRRLARTRHLLDPVPGDSGGLHTGTLPGGWADLRNIHGSILTNGPFDEFHHIADMRKHHGNNGQFGINKLAFHIYPLIANKVKGSRPFKIKEGKSYGFDPSGRSIPLFMPGLRQEDFNWDNWFSVHEWEVTSPVSCRLLAHEEFEIDIPLIQSLVKNVVITAQSAMDLYKITGYRFKGEERLYAVLKSLASSAELTQPDVFNQLVEKALVKDCGKNVLLENAMLLSIDNTFINPTFITAGCLDNISVSSPSVNKIIIDPENGSFLLPNPTQADKIQVTYHYGFSAKIGAGTYNRSVPDESDLPKSHITGGGLIPPVKILNKGVTSINDNNTYGPVFNKMNVQNMILRSANGTRPYIRLNEDWVLGGSDEDSALCLDGLWIGASKECKLILRGSFTCVTLRHCTLDPGGHGNEKDLAGGELFPVPLEIDGKIDCLVIDASLTGSLSTGPDGQVENIMIRDSIIQSNKNDHSAIKIMYGDVNMEQVTVIGNMEVHRLWANNTLVAGNVTATDTQQGCFRFSTANEMSHLPRRYESYLHSSDMNHWFISLCFGQPGYARIRESAPESVRSGGENGSEIGAFNTLLNSVKCDNLLNKIEEYMPFGLIPIFIQHTK
jgi:hypothetical protein